MARGPATFKKQDVTRLIEAAVSAGIKIEEIDCKIGNCKFTLKTTKTALAVPEVNEWDAVK